MYKIIFIILCTHLFWVCPAHADALREVTICTDSDPTPPEKIKLDAQGKKIIPVEGAAIDIIRAVFAHMGQKVEFIGDLPWKRCLHEVEMGDIDFALGVYYNEERAKIYDYSTHYNTLTPQLFYLASKPLQVTESKDLSNYKGCGIYGSSYVHFKIKSEDLSMGSDYSSLYRKLLANRCDYFAEELESVYESNGGKEFLANPLIRHIAPDWAQRPSRHLVTAKNGQNSAMLVQINSALEFVIKSGQAEQIWKKTMGDIPYVP